MARILRLLNKEIQFLGILDTDTEIVTSQLFNSRNLYKRIRRQFPKLKWLISSLLQDPVHTFAYQKKFYLRKINEFQTAIGLRREPEPDAAMLHIDAIKSKLVEAYEKYVIRPYEGPIILFRARTRSYFVVDFIYLG